jgi:hypothetical protein
VGCCSSSPATSGSLGWQSGIHYVDGTPKASSARVTEALDRTTGGSITRCPGVQLPVRPTSLRFGTRSAARRGIFKVSFACDLDCRYWVRLENAGTHATKLAAKGLAEVGELVQADRGTRRLKAGTYQVTASISAYPSREPGPGDSACGPSFLLP